MVDSRFRCLMLLFHSTCFSLPSFLYISNKKRTHLLGHFSFIFLAVTFLFYKNKNELLRLTFLASTRRVDPSALAFSLSSHRYSHIGLLVLALAFSVNNKHVFWSTGPSRSTDLVLWFQKVSCRCSWWSCYQLYCPFRSQKGSRLGSGTTSCLISYNTYCHIG